MTLDKDSIPVGRVSMTYYSSPDGANTMADVFGFPKPYIDDSYAPFDIGQDIEFAKIHSLKEIHSTDGGKVCLDYELNGYPVGGIRIKSVGT